MIFGTTPNKKRDALDFIRDHQETFYLTGSRYFGTSLDDSDWDFFVAESPALMESFRNSGLDWKLKEAFYTDETIALVLTCENVDVQIIKPAAFLRKKKIQNQIRLLLANFPAMQNFSKNQMRLLWHILLSK